MMIAHGWNEITTEIPYWNHVGGQVNDGLTNRRAAEVLLFNS
jgi:GH24 family phage-related lysozyme (muramidase)